MTAPNESDPESNGSSIGSAGNQALSYLLSGALLGGLMGWGLRAWTGQSWTVLIGLLAGVALSWYTIWLRYVRPAREAQSGPNLDSADEEKR